MSCSVSFSSLSNHELKLPTCFSLRMQIPVHTSGTQVFHETMFAIRSTNTRLSPSSMKSLNGFKVITIDVGFTKFEFRHDTMDRGRIAGKDGRCETIVTIIGQFQSLVQGLKFHHGQDGAKDFLSHNGILLLYIGQYGGFKMVSRWDVKIEFAARFNARSVIYGHLDHVGHLIQLHAMNETTHLHVFIIGETHFGTFHLSYQLFQKFIVDTFLNINAFGGIANLS
mmetsp:Transcript_4842/g.10284  ORF Transcript_4842/g.10284 Transcript_4842/m.10284 type:complete len:225 (+) Transcript_4842:203-877(+)